MRRLLLTTASVFALGFGGIGLANANDTQQQQGLSGTSTPPTASATIPAKNPTTMTTHRTTRPVAHQAMTKTTRMSRSEIIQAQRRLHADGLYRGRIDGRFNTGTRIALRHFQQQNHLPLTARLDNRTLGNLMGGGMGQGSSRPPKAATHARTMGKGLQQNVNQPGGQNTNTMGQGSGGEQPNATPMTPPNQSAAPNNGGTNNPTPNTSTDNNTKK